MSFLKNIHYKYQDFGHQKSIIFSNSLGTNISMWDSVVDILKNEFNILRYDTRGHGESLFIDRETFKIADLGNDVIELIDNLELEKVYFCGISMGGLIGQWLGINAPNHFQKIILANTAAKIGNNETWNSRIGLVKNEGFEELSKVTETRWFTEDFRKVNSNKVKAIIDKFKLNNIDGYIACCEAIRDADFRRELHQLIASTLIISANHDTVTTTEDAIFLVSKIPDSKHIILNAAHLSAVERWENFAKAIANS
jgi:3-oxoadipate enol-lactonase